MYQRVSAGYSTEPEVIIVIEAFREEGREGLID
jgi:hypothetical protein